MMIVTSDYYEFRTVILAYSIPRYDRWILLSEKGNTWLFSYECSQLL